MSYRANPNQAAASPITTLHFIVSAVWCWSSAEHTQNNTISPRNQFVRFPSFSDAYECVEVIEYVTIERALRRAIVNLPIKHTQESPTPIYRGCDGFLGLCCLSSIPTVIRAMSKRSTFVSANCSMCCAAHDINNNIMTC